MPTNMAFHDLTPGKIVPPNAKTLLGLGFKFIITPTHTTGEGDMFRTTDRLNRDFKLRVFFGGAMDRDVHNSKLFVKSDWTPTDGEVPGWVYARLSKFFRRVRNKFNKKRAISNLLPFQQRLMDQLINDNNLLFPDTDKGLGPSAVTYNQYVQDVLRHLSNGDVYQRLTENEATQLANDLRSEIEKWLEDYKRWIEAGPAHCISSHMAKNATSPFGQFYILYKIHKGARDDGSWPTRPVCSDVTSYPHILGKYVMEQLQPVAQTQPSYFKDTFELKKLLDDLELPPNASLFTADATSMYTNIPTEPALEELAAYLRTNAGTPKHHYHCDSLTAALEIVFRNNLFKFGDTFWKQISGTGMGVCPAPPWATIFFAILENKELPRWTQFIFLYKRFIDDIIGVWLHDPDPSADAQNWNHFKATWQTHHGLEWIFSERTQEVNFMDLTISISNNRFHTTIYEKDLNLYLYLPPHSSHPKGVFTGLVLGKVLRI